ncbi:hypothetical protein F5Y04DRAFT_246128 [Hypomontagnella monticulosa]|nr:hypothetical protein F5Y04DRAFT_246128 [Hypomontagnella monticulosa]
MWLVNSVLELSSVHGPIQYGLHHSIARVEVATSQRPVRFINHSISLDQTSWLSFPAGHLKVPISTSVLIIYNQNVAMDNLKLTPSNSKARDPPRLFLHPSPAASHVSLSGMVAASPAVPPVAASTATANANTSGTSTQHQQQSQAPPSLARSASLLNARNRTTVTRHQTADSARTADRTDALWAEMQATLTEVELSASGGTHIFGPEHDRKLAELRAAQIKLAQAWARSEAEDSVDTTAAKSEVSNLKGALGELGISAAAGTGLGPTISATAGRAAAEGTEGGKSTAGTASLRPGSSGTNRERLGAKLEEETERDILLARNRREANDRYFSKIDQGVRDVVEKLEEVAVAMKAVEEETRNVWGDGDDGAAAPENTKT